MDTLPVTLTLGGSDVRFVRHDEVPMDRVIPSPFQPRKQLDPLVVDSLKESILAVGVLQRPRVREQGGARDGATVYYELVFGHQRAEACRALGWTTLPVEVIACDDLTSRRMTLHENIKSSRLHPIEHAEAIVKFMDATLSHDPAYDLLEGDSSAARIAQVLTILTQAPPQGAAPSPVREMVAAKEGLIRQILREMAGKEPRAFLTTDVTLLQLPDEILNATVERGLKKGHARALGQLLAKEPEMFQEVLTRGVPNPQQGEEERSWTPLERAPAASIRGLYAPRKGDLDEGPGGYDGFDADRMYRGYEAPYMPIGVPNRASDDGDEGEGMPWDSADEGPLSPMFALPLATLAEAHGGLTTLAAAEWAATIREAGDGAPMATQQWLAIQRLATEVLGQLN